MTTLPISFFPSLLLIPAICFTICHANSNLLCIPSEREALLKFKNHLIDPSNSLSSWVEGGDCCKWIGVVCHNSTGHVHQLHLAALSSYDQSAINPSLLELKHLSFLDLSNNNFGSIPIPKFLGMLESLTYLNLSNAQFQGAIPHNLGNLSKLHYLDLGGNYLKPKSLQWVSGLSSLEYLDLSSADLHKANDWVQVTLKLPSLLELHLSACGLEDYPSPISVNSTKSLVVLDLSSNHFSSVPKWISSLHGLVSIDLSFCFLEGPIPDYFGNTSFLEVLDLSWNHLNSSILNSLYSLNRLQFLSLSSNQLQGTISSAIGNLSSVTHLDLSNNKIEGGISEILQSLSRCCLDSLESLDMTNNQLSGHLTDQLGQFKNLSYLSLAQNKISGPIPSSIGELSSLETLDFGHNLLEGVVFEAHFFNLTRLTTLKASDNRLRFEPNSNWIPPFQCERIELGHWHLGPKFPQWLKFQKKLSYLDIFHVGISDVMPTWFLNLPTQFEYLNLSSNQLTGEISYLNVRDSVDLSSNRFTGPLPRVISTLCILHLSNNSFSGSLSELICNPSLTGMVALYLDTNLLIGEIPDCWNHWEILAYLNLANNNLTGKIPPTLGYTYPFLINLRNNSMFGELPYTLRNSWSLVMLDLSENHFSGSVPAWIGDKLSNLVVLSLRSNNFDGHIPHKICDLQFLQNLDLANNNISGVIPKCFNNLSAMATKIKTNNEFSLSLSNFYKFYLKALLVLKGREDEYGSTLGLVTSMDLSANSLTGEIPKKIGSLVGLLSLNFSGNLLTGNIPNSIGNMELMESLDLSMNRLNGEIPPSFSNLNFLNHFNVSYNNLTGQIPTSTQLQSFENLSYVGNHLCGPPLSKNCTSKGIPTDVANNGSSNEGSKVNWLYVSIVLGFVMGFWGVVAPLFFIRSWRIAYYRKLDHICGKLHVFWATMGM
ncbi:hypothetical protein ERO13_D11G307800v2 [Gossypium hirsutum]|uniref:Receptor-like protein EIX2 n=1 Tax=Gossypium hirsutum TaxID=3635 RepID=A0A1U8LUG2_GOSHI|nr:receptor-like protein EIX2 [Gossypium hirsutum]KAG4123109.1 hypothetical protein ERO13_D11G307800v2 [Gossypium hirsutum]